MAQTFESPPPGRPLPHRMWLSQEACMYSEDLGKRRSSADTMLRVPGRVISALVSYSLNGAVVG